MAAEGHIPGWSRIFPAALSALESSNRIPPCRDLRRIKIFSAGGFNYNLTIHDLRSQRAMKILGKVVGFP
jgi:hypothetical protein